MKYKNTYIDQVTFDLDEHGTTKVCTMHGTFINKKDRSMDNSTANTD